MVDNQENINYYELFKIDSTATLDEIKKSYKKLSLQWHPDKNPNSLEEAERMFKIISEGYQTLSDPQRRSEYDYKLTNPQRFSTPQMASSWDYTFSQPHYHFVDPRELFQSFFGSNNLFRSHFDSHFAGFHPTPFFSPMSNPFQSFGNQFPFSGAHHSPFNSGFPTLDPISYHRGGPGNFSQFHDHFSNHFANHFNHLNNSFSDQTSSSQSQSYSFGNGGASTQTVVNIVNGQRTSTTTTTDAQGNQTVKQEFPDGRVRVTLNGIEQSQAGNPPLIDLTKS